jgi:hypothetical protein
MEFLEAEPDLIEFLNDFYAKIILSKLRFSILGEFYGIFIKPFFFLLFSISDFQQSVKNVNQQFRVRRTLKSSNSQVIASSLLIVLVLSAICDVTGESSSFFFFSTLLVRTLNSWEQLRKSMRLEKIH